MITPDRQPRATHPGVAAMAVVPVLAIVAVTAYLDSRTAVRDEVLPGAGPAWLAAVTGLALALPGAVLLRRDRRHPVAWVLWITGLLWALDALAQAWLVYSTALKPALPGASAAFWIYHRLGAVLLLSLPLVLLLFPDGRLPTGRWRWAAWISLGATTSLPLVSLAVPSRIAATVSQETYPAAFAGLNLDPTTIALPDPVWTALFAGAQSLMPFGLVVPFAIVVRRYRGAAGEHRGAMRWLLWAAVVDLLVVGSVMVLPPIWASIGLMLAIGVTGFAVAVGVAAPRLVDIDRLLPATVRFAALAAVVVLVDLAVVGLARLMLGDRLGERDAALVALLVVLAVYGPVRQRLWLLARRLVLGRRDDRYGLVAGLAEQLERTDTAEEQLLTTARTVAEAFRVRYVGVEVVHHGGGHLIAEHGARPPQTYALPIAYRGETVGQLILPAHGARAALSTRDERLLADMVRQAAASARMSYLAQELQASRERIVSAREEERHRLRRDLHDGLGPTLSAVALRIDTARNLIRASPMEADPVLRTARDDITLAVADVRRLVHDLRPPALDDVGLVAAVRQQGDRLRSPQLAVRVDGDPELPALPAATEVAAYRIASEALTNVIRHAGAQRCRVTLRATDTDLVVEVSDDGVGIPDGTPAGVGLVSLRERAEELGGRCRVWSPEGGGTIVRAELPLPRRGEQ